MLVCREYLRGPNMISGIYGSIYGVKKKKKKKQTRKQKQTDLAKKFSVELKDRATKPELDFMSFLDSNHFAYVFQKPFKNGKSFFIVDFYLKEYNVVVEIDGGYHDTPEQRSRDEKRTYWLKRINQVKDVVRVKNEEVCGDQDALLKKILSSCCPQSKGLL